MAIQGLIYKNSDDCQSALSGFVDINSCVDTSGIKYDAPSRQINLWTLEPPLTHPTIDLFLSQKKKLNASATGMLLGPSIRL